MEIDLNKLDKKKFLNRMIIPHIALTTFKYRARAASILKKIHADITIDQAIILKLLTVYGDMNQQEIAGCLYKDKSNLSRMCELLESRGYVTRRPDMKNNRVVKILTITDKGKLYMSKMQKVAEHLHSVATDGLTQDEIETLRRVTSKIRENLNKDIEGIL